MDYKEFAEHPDFSSRAKVAEWVETAATVIVKLLARTEAAEAARLMGYEVIEDEQEKQPTRASILEEAKRCVCDWKEKDYGIYDNSFETVAELWKTYIEQGCVDDGVDVFLGPKDVAMLMALLQIAHVSCGTATDENFVDLAAYTAYCGEIVGGKK